MSIGIRGAWASLAWILPSAALLGSAVIARGGVSPDAPPVTNAPAVAVAPIVVTAPPLVAQDAVTAYGGRVSVVDRDQLRAAGAQDLQGAVRRVPGVTISRYTLLGAFGGADGGSVYIRGQGAGRPGADIVLYEDDVPRKVGVWDHPLLDVLALDHADRITVYKGPQPVFNAGTFGSMNLESRRCRTPGRETEADVMVGEHATLAGRLHHGGRGEGMDYYGGYAFKSTDGHRPHSMADLMSLYGRVGAVLGEGIALSARVTVTDNSVEDPGVAGGPVPVRDRFATRTVTTSARLDNTGERLHGFALVYHEDGRIRWDKDAINGPGTPPGASDTDWENYGFRLNQTLALGPTRLFAALEGGSEGGSTENRTLQGQVPFAYEDRYETLSPGLALDARFDIGGDWSVQPSAGIRAYFHNTFDYETAPQAGLVLRGGGWTWSCSAARGVHYPGVYAAGIAATTLDRLEAEILDHVETGAQWQSPRERIVLGVSVFRDRTENRLQWTPAGLVNTGRSDMDGVELTARVRVLECLALYGAITLLDPEDARTPRAPEWSASAGMTLDVTRRLRLHADVDAVDRQYAFNGRAGERERQVAEPVDRYAVGGIRLSYSPPLADDDLRLTLYAACENVADAAVETLPGYPLPGRFYSGGVQVAF